MNKISYVICNALLMIPPFLNAAISRPNIPEDLHLYQCFPTFLPWKKPWNNFSYPEEPLWQHFQVRKQKDSWQNLEISPALKKTFRVMSRNIWNFSRYFKCVCIHTTISRRTHTDIPRNSGFRETLFWKQWLYTVYQTVRRHNKNNHNRDTPGVKASVSRNSGFSFPEETLFYLHKFVDYFGLKEG